MKVVLATLFMLVCLPLSLCTAVGAEDCPADRVTVVTSLYRDFAGEKSPDLFDQPLSVLKRSFTPGLARLLIEERHRREGPPAQLGNLDFELLSGSQDPDIHELGFHPSGKGDVIALYRTSTGQKVHIRYHLISAGDGWRIDDITYTRPRCTLRGLLERHDDPDTRSSGSQTFREPSLEAAPIKPLPARVTVPKRGELTEADAFLNSEYRKLTTGLGICARERLIRAQRAWIKERDSFAASQPSRREEALLHATKQRSAELAAILAGPVLPAN